LVIREDKELREQLDPLVIQHKVVEVLQDQQELRETKDRQHRQEPRDQRVQQHLQDLRVSKVLRVPKVTKVLRVTHQLVIRELKVHRVRQEEQVIPLKVE